MNYEQKYNAALERARELSKTVTGANYEYIFPELVESDDERIRNWLIGYFHQYKEDGMEKYANGLKVESIIAWLEKQQPLDKEELTGGALKHVARQFMNWLDASTPEGKMCLSNMECEDIENAFLKDDWARIVNYIKKKLEKRGEQKQWEPNAAQLIVIKDLIEDKNTSKVNKVILRGMLDDVKQLINSRKREIDNAYLQGICDAKHEIEKQGEQKPDDKAESKFHEGDWVILNGVVAKILDKQKYGFVGLDIDRKDFFCNYGHTDSMRLWTINDAKDGDVLACPSDLGDRMVVFIFKQLVNHASEIDCHCCIDANGIFDPCLNDCCYVGDVSRGDYAPATKEQRDLLFQKMKDAGYEWDNVKNILKKMETSNKESDKKIELEIRNFIWRYPEKLPERYKWLAWFEKQDKQTHVELGQSKATKTSDQELESKKLDPDEVIAWIVANICDFEYYVILFKQDFEL